VDSLISAAMSRVSRPAALNPEPSMARVRFPRRGPGSPRPGHATMKPVSVRWGARAF